MTSATRFQRHIFAFGFGNSLVFPFAVGATTLLVPGQSRPAVVLKAIDNYDLSSLSQSMSAAEILSEEIYHAWKAKVGHGPTEELGSTEMQHIYLSNSLDDHRLGAAGARVPGYEIRLETSNGKPAGAGEEGIIAVADNFTIS